MTLSSQVVVRRDMASTAARLPRQADSQPLSLVQGRHRSGRIGVDVVPLTVVVDSVALAGAALAVSLSRTSVLLLATLILGLNAAGGHYKARIAPSLLDELPGLTGRALVAGALATAFRLNLNLPVHDGPVFAALAFIVLACSGRAVGYPVIRNYRRHKREGRATIIVGCGRVGNQVATTLLEHPEYGLTPVGYLDDDPLVLSDDAPVPLLGSTQSLGRILVANRISHVIVAFTKCRESELVETLRTCDRLACEIFFVPRLYELHGRGRDTELIWGLPLTRLSRPAYRAATWRAKRMFDVVIASAGLAVLSPLLALCALAARLEGGPGVIFRQERVGLDGRPFTILKFRTLKPANDLESSQCWNIGSDPRLGSVGRTLRCLSFDELPQLWNVVRGDMSLVGPRPERPFFVDEFTKQFPRYVARHRVPVGITGWAQVSGLRGDTDIADRVRFDNYYIENWSLWGDIKIMLRTAGQVVGRRGL